MPSVDSIGLVIEVRCSIALLASEVGRESTCRLAPLDDVGPTPHTTNRKLSHRSRKLILPGESVRSLPGHAEQLSNLGSADQVHCVEITEITSCSRATVRRMVLLGSNYERWLRRRCNVDGARNTSEVADRARP